MKIEHTFLLLVIALGLTGCGSFFRELFPPNEPSSAVVVHCREAPEAAEEE
ncbi:MAG: hypothetical protein VYE22_34560 [Myxococcota bacterium]|nr:hypothetical protein [Myxococcota bacterium]